MNDINLLTEIAKVARELYEKSGRVEGRDLDNWLEAEKIVKSRYKYIYKRDGSIFSFLQLLLSFSNTLLLWLKTKKPIPFTRTGSDFRQNIRIKIFPPSSGIMV
jgi:hypothetical protein